MSRGEFEVTRKKVEDMLIASIRFRGQYEEVGKYMDKLFQHVDKYVNGPAFALYHSQDYEKGHDVEACAPVSQAVETDEIKSRILEGGEMLSAVHRGPYDALSSAWEKFYEHIERNKVELGKGPAREIYLEYDAENPENHVTEIQEPLPKEE